MVRGCERRIFYVKNPGGDIFDEAYFILRRQEKAGTVRSRTATPREIELEAMRIAEGAAGAMPREGADGDRIRAFIAGAAVSAVGICAVGAAIYAAVAVF